MALTRLVKKRIEKQKKIENRRNKARRLRRDLQQRKTQSTLHYTSRRNRAFDQAVKNLKKRKKTETKEDSPK